MCGSGWILTLLRQLQPFISATSRLLRPVSPQRYIDHRHASRCPRGGGRVIKKAMDFSDASGEKPVNTPAVSRTLARCAVVLSVQCRSFFTSAARAGANLALMCVYPCLTVSACACVCVEEGVLCPRHAAQHVSAPARYVFFFFFTGFDKSGR